MRGSLLEPETREAVPWHLLFGGQFKTSAHLTQRLYASWDLAILKQVCEELCAQKCSLWHHLQW